MLLIFTETFFSTRGIQPGPRDKILVLEALAARGKKAGNMECVRTRVHVRRTPSSCCQSALCRHRCDRSDEAAAADRAPRRGAARQRESTFPDAKFVFPESQRASQEGRGSREDGTNQTEPRGLLVFGSSQS